MYIGYWATIRKKIQVNNKIIHYIFGKIIVILQTNFYYITNNNFLRK